jgi:hypothetical protein
MITRNTSFTQGGMVAGRVVLLLAFIATAFGFLHTYDFSHLPTDRFLYGVFFAHTSFLYFLEYLTNFFSKEISRNRFTFNVFAIVVGALTGLLFFGGMVEIINAYEVERISAGPAVEMVAIIGMTFALAIVIIQRLAHKEEN